MNIGTASPRATALALTLGIGAVLALAAAPEAKASIFLQTNGAAACKATTPAGHSAFYASNLALLNISDSNQTLSCSMPTWGLGYGSNNVQTTFYWSSGATGGTVVCTAQSGYVYRETNVAQGNTQSRTLGVNGYVEMTFPGLLRPNSNYSTHMICNVPPGFKLGLIMPIDADPPAGYAWN